MSLLFQKIKCILCENTKPSAKLITVVSKMIVSTTKTVNLNLFEIL